MFVHFKFEEFNSLYLKAMWDYVGIVPYHFIPFNHHIVFLGNI